jgi:MerR family transcriptional regulator, light-induced transcriptional regulator
MGPETLNLQATADALGVHYQTAYRWVRDGQIAAGKIGGSYDVDAREVERFLSHRLVPAAPPLTMRVRNWSTQLERFEAALLDGDELGAREITDRLSEGNVAIVDVCEEVIAPCMRDIGEAWHNGTVSIAQEHRATAIVERILGRLASHPRGRPRGVAVVSSPPGDLHGLPSAMAALVLREDRWKVHHLGADTPLEELAKFAIEVVQARLVVLSSALFPSGPVSASGTSSRSGTLGNVSMSNQEFRTTLDASGVRLLEGGPGTTLRTLLALARSETETGASNA